MTAASITDQTAKRIAEARAALGRRLVHFRKDRRGVSALEFALTLPVMLGLYLGSAGVTQGVSIQRKVTLTAHAIADLASQNPSISSAQMTNILNAGSAIIAPYPSANLAETISEVTIDGSGNATVAWSVTLNGTALTVGQAVTVPSTLLVPNSYLILGQASYSYDPTSGYVLTNTMSLTDQYFMRPRQSNAVAYSG
jgi:Flp pilus assembly protein TadG